MKRIIPYLGLRFENRKKFKYLTCCLNTYLDVLQILSASLAKRCTGGYKWHESIMIGFGMLGRAELTFIVINIAYTKSHLITLEQFCTLILTLFLLNITVPTMIKWWKPYYKGDKHFSLFGTTLSKK